MKCKICGTKSDNQTVLCPGCGINLSQARVMSVKKKKNGCLVALLAVVGTIVGLILVGIIGSSFSGINNNSGNGGTVEAIIQEAKGFADAGEYKEALKRISIAESKGKGEEVAEIRTICEEEIAKRTSELVQYFDIKKDEVVQTTFISPNDVKKTGLIFYPYIGEKDFKGYMKFRIGYAELNDPGVFTDIKIRCGETLLDVMYNPMNKIYDSGITGYDVKFYEVVDIDFKGDILKLLSGDMEENIIVRFEDVSNTVKDYTVSSEQKTAIKRILEYYSYKYE